MIAQKMHPYVGQYMGQHECMRYAAIVRMVAMGLNYVLKDGILPACYQEVFHSAVELCEDIVESAYYASDRSNVQREMLIGMSEATIWFSNLTKCHARIYSRVTTYEDIMDVADSLDTLAKEEATPHAYPDEWIQSLREFFLSLWAAVEEERKKEGVTGDVDFSLYPEVSMKYQ